MSRSDDDENTRQPRSRRKPVEDDREDDFDDEPMIGPAINWPVVSVVLWAVAKWGAIAIGGLLVCVAFSATAVQGAAIAGIACFFGILARIFQAEEHRARG